MKAGDIIVAVAGVDTTGRTLEELGEALRGPEGSTVQVTIRPAGDAIERLAEP